MAGLWSDEDERVPGRARCDRCPRWSPPGTAGPVTTGPAPALEPAG